MHPLNGAEALKASRANPNDRFNTPGSVTQLAPDAAAPAAATAPTAPPPTIDAPARPSVAPAPSDSAPAVVAARPAGFSGPNTNDTRAQRPAIPNSLAAAVLLTAVGGLLYFTVLSDRSEGVFSSIFNASPHRATAGMVISNDDPGPTDVDTLIAASTNSVSAPILPRAQRGPGRTAYGAPAKPAARPTAARPEPARQAERAEAMPELVLMGLSRAGKGRRASAIINGETLLPGQSIAGHTLIQILDDSVILESNGHIFGLGLGSSPTATP